MTLRMVCSFYKTKNHRMSDGTINDIVQQSTHVSPRWGQKIVSKYMGRYQ